MILKVQLMGDRGGGNHRQPPLFFTFSVTDQSSLSATSSSTATKVLHESVYAHKKGKPLTPNTTFCRFPYIKGENANVFYRLHLSCLRCCEI